MLDDDNVTNPAGATRLDLGVGMMISPGLAPVLDDLDDLVDVYEVEPQTFRTLTPERHDRWGSDRAALAAVAGRGKPVLAHGVGAPVGGAAPPDIAMIEQFGQSVELLGAVAASEHLASSAVRVRGRTIDVGILMPPCPSGEGVARAASAVRAYQRALDVPFSIENGASYLRPRCDERRDSDIVRGVVELTGCGVVLDLHNLWCNERNGRETVADALANLPLDAVTEVHLAGGAVFDGVYVDAHSGPTPDSLLAIAADALPRLANARAVIFEISAAAVWRLGLDPLRAHLAALGSLVAESRRVVPQAPTPAPVRVNAGTVVDEPASPEAWQLGLAQAITGAELGAGLDAGSGAGPFVDEPGVRVMRRLVDRGRRGRIASTARLTTRLLIVMLDDEGLDSVLDRYCRLTPLRRCGHDEAEAFLDFVEVHLRDTIPRLADAVALDRAMMQITVAGGSVELMLDGDPDELTAALGDGRAPAPGTTGHVSPRQRRRPWRAGPRRVGRNPLPDRRPCSGRRSACPTRAARRGRSRWSPSRRSSRTRTADARRRCTTRLGRRAGSTCP
jgi:uncharacterized protein